ncbi:hypothetical protein [Streptomyces sp. bgisy060]|uniref:hypothetical protein n=1 Tax=Streptomyces sp. bgisy060 TaxID=3413775 RepID=UPI003EC0AA1B
MKRARAVELIEQLLHRLDDSTEWPLGLVQQVWLFAASRVARLSRRTSMSPYGSTATSR